ncbi:7-carboxy-7-deazaguanine synthase [Pseudomonas sp. URIL14HWK12:I9]|nr:7-carboxy-7-deazaguanine synthase [Pseudomonas sp. URIL14HWK12:I12]PVZ27756.1 7-carboxy-7-deazaguanine synthase [Pseudomonas sp. URIL14HWK12:I10]PVZ38645.1 7-carboxy-7-deazaguanine synthase [Pseudomonas sp. URIL14HWK12:I11]SNZ02532.1 7-carboxy-7-deazaguanine synthase [Pseudomonas sp. URIL14HWK12:I9]
MACFAVTPVASMHKTLRITEVFFSLQGEARTSGLPTVFVRLTGCPLRCQYCDSAYAFSGGQLLTLEAILEQVASYRPRYVCVTGGEPLAQPNVHPLLERLCDAGYEVSLETSGALDISAVDPRVSRVVDLKTPDSKESHRNLYENLALLTPNDQVKFVLCSRGDYDWAVSKLIEYRLEQRAGEVLFSPSATQLKGRDLADWLVSDNLPVRMQLQLHKILWNDEPGR